VLPGLREFIFCVVATHPKSLGMDSSLGWIVDTFVVVDASLVVRGVEYKGQIMLIENRYESKVFWRIFNPGDTSFWGGVREGTVEAGQNIGPLSHPSGRFKLELKQIDVLGPFISSAGAIYNNGDSYVLDALGRLALLGEITPPQDSVIRQVLAFSPAIHGFKFPNSFDRTSFPVQEIAGFPITANAFGLCGGMVYAARDYFQSGLTPPGTSTPPVGGPLFDLLWRRLIDSFNLPFGSGNPARYVQLMSPAVADAGPPTVFGVLSRMDEIVRLEWPKIMASIDAGQTCPIALVYHKTGDVAKLFSNHQVLVYGYEIRGSHVTLCIYDPNAPGSEHFIGFDTSNINVHSITYSFGLTAPAKLWSFFATDYVFVPVPSVPAHSWDSGWRSVGRAVAGSPDLASMNSGHLAVFAPGIERALWFSETQVAEGSQIWAEWRSLGGVITSSPGAVSWGDNRLDVFARGADGALWHIWRDGANWSGWESLGGQIKGSPDACSWAHGRLDVFARGTDDTLQHIWFDQAWSGWESLGGQLSSDPSAVSWGPGRIDVFGRAQDASLAHLWYDAGWSSWESLGGGLSSAPDAASWGPGRLDVFIRGTDRQLWQLSYEGGWQSWKPLGGLLLTDPSAVALAADRMAVVVVGEDMGLWIKQYS
jgi:Repeat of unknown function (DUF346)